MTDTHLPNYRPVLLNHTIFTCSVVKTKPTADTNREASNRKQSDTTGHNREASDKSSPLHYATQLYSLRKHATNVYPM